MWILVVLVVGAPKERPYTACTLNCAVWQIHRRDHRCVCFWPETDDMRGKGFGVLRILLETVPISPELPRLRPRTHIIRSEAFGTTPNGNFVGSKAPYSQL